MSGGALPCRASGTLVVNCSFCSGSILNETFGCEAWYWSASFFHSVSAGSAVPLCHQVRVTVWLLFGLLPFEPLFPPLPLLHAADSPTVAARTRTPHVRTLRMVWSSPWTLSTRPGLHWSARDSREFARVLRTMSIVVDNVF